MQRFTRDQMAARVARDIPEGCLRQPRHRPADDGRQSSAEGSRDPAAQRERTAGDGSGASARLRRTSDLINAGKQPVTLLPGGAYFHHADSFAMMRGGHLDFCVLGAFQVSETGDLANWHTGAPDAIPAVGGAMDLAIGAKRVYVMMEHTTKQGQSKIVDRCTYPLTGIGCVNRIFTDLAVLDVTPRGLEVLEIVDGLSFDELERITGVPLDGRVPSADEGITMNEAFICDAVRTPFGRYGGALATVRADDLAAVPLRALMQRNPNVDWSAVDDVVYGCANQAGEDNRNVGRMAALLAGLPVEVPGTTVNRLCGSSMDAIGIAARAIKSGETSLMLAGGVESMSRAPFVQGKATEAFSRAAKIEDTTIGWRFVNPLMKSRYGVDSMPETAENVAQEFNVSRADQDAFALRSQQRAAAAIAAGRLAEEIVPVSVAQKKGRPGRR